MIKIAMIRHGKTYGNTLGRYIGVTDEHCVRKGKRDWNSGRWILLSFCSSAR